MKALSGLEQLRLMVAGKLPPPRMAELMSMELGRVAEGDVIFTATASGQHTNPMGGVHGGFAATVLDSVTGCAVHSTLPPGRAYATVDFSVQMIRPVPVDVPLEAIGKVLNVSRRVGFAEGWLQDTNGKRYAHATATCAIFESP
jgi:uncharacterized protein (TIGR00369 family)